MEKEKERVLKGERKSIDENAPVSFHALVICDSTLGVLEFLLDNYLGIDELDERLRTPLMNACRFKKSNIAKLLIEHGADVSELKSLILL